VTPAEIDLGALGFEQGAHVLLKRALRALAPGAALRVRGADPSLAVDLRAFARAQGHGFQPGDPSAAGGHWVLTRGGAQVGRWRGAERAGGANPGSPPGVISQPSQRWGLAARGAQVEAGAPAFAFRYAAREEVWSDDAARLYLQAAGAQWDPQTAIGWDAPCDLPDEVEDAVVQVMTYLIENETAALLVPARFLAQIHPHFREVLQLLAVQAADEARHIEVFTRRALLKRANPALSTAGGQASLKTLIDEPDFAMASFLLSVLGEGTFLSLLWFLREHAPDPITRQVAQLAAQDEARHVAFGLSHLRRHIAADPALMGRLAMAVETRHRALQDTAGLNEEVFDALVVLAAGGFEHADLARGYAAVQALKADMDQARRARLARLGFEPDEAAALSALHTRNFM
jgi:hypothetical protein